MKVRLCQNYTPFYCLMKTAPHFSSIFLVFSSRLSIKRLFLGGLLSIYLSRICVFTDSTSFLSSFADILTAPCPKIISCSSPSDVATCTLHSRGGLFTVFQYSDPPFSASFCVHCKYIVIFINSANISFNKVTVKTTITVIWLLNP